MSRGGRGGFGGGRNAINKMGGRDLPFDIDAELENRYDKLEFGDDLELFPERNLTFPEPPNAAERKSFAIGKRIRGKMRNGPLFANLDRTAGMKRSRAAAEYDAFNPPDTYRKQTAKKERSVADVSTIEIEKTLFPKELWLENITEGTAKGKKISRKNARTLADRLAKFDDNADAKGENGEEEVEEKDDEDGSEEVEDDDFDDEDENDDYNGERYFQTGSDDGEGIGGGDDGGADDGY